LADDSRADAFLLARAFKQAGMLYTVKSVHDGTGVIKYLKGEGDYANRAEYPLPGLILLDMRMPVMSGFDVLKWKQQSEFADLPVVVIGDCMSKETVARACQYGASCVVSKTQDLAEFTEELKKAISTLLPVGSGQAV
jgi:CheY-like chemotaxis protein